ncbi:MAG TPA: type ISP restriction/modification enzyme, partial [Desulfobacterales bacterium]|nr:type ISP restriction/modification enzyme [Desulfobacterales bacterium]
MESIAPDVLITNEPVHIDCGAPDYILTRQKIPVGYIEAKDIGKPLTSKDYKEQFERYRNSLNNLIITDYLEFKLYRDGEFVTSLAIGEIQGNRIVAKNENFSAFSDLIKDFCLHTGQTIKSSAKLAKMMAGKARLLQKVIENALTSDHENQADSSLKDQLNAFRQILIHDISAKEFADIYAQTIAYGMFAARLHDPSLESFSRMEAANLIPKSNPFLRKLFQYIAGYDLDSRIIWIVDALADIFRATNVAELLKDFGKATQKHDPIIHFYETFLAEYDPALRKSRGVFYTPEPVVNFIVRAVDDILKNDFNLQEGLANTSKITKKVEVQGQTIEKEFHRVQILDPAAGTGTFLAEVIKQIYKRFEGQQGIWSDYVEEHLIPRLNGFEILMASYSMAHLKLDLLLRETGYKPKNEQRLKVFLTNSLEEHHPETGTLFTSWLSAEANQANTIKRDTQVMVVLGNPPYNVSSSNKGEWIQNLIAAYKKDLNEKKLNLDDDYIKFIRYGENFIEKNGEGILAFISNNSFIDGITYRQMRKHLLETFDKIFILDLHGNAKKKETSPDGSKDENVFDIMQGVSINLFVKNNKKKKGELAQVQHLDLHGLREYKYEQLFEKNINSIEWSSLNYQEPYFFFVPKNFKEIEHYNQWFSLNELFFDYNSGVKTDRDNLFIGFDSTEIHERFQLLLSKNIDKKFIEKFRVIDSGSYKITEKIKSVQFDKNFITKIQYRIFDWRYIYYDKKIVSRPAQKAMKHIFQRDNVGLIFKRQAKEEKCGYTNFFISKTLIIDGLFAIDPLGREVIAPLFLYSNENSLINSKNLIRIPNLNMDIVNQIAVKIGLQFSSEKEKNNFTFASIDLLDYIYAVLHSPTYREKYKEFLKIDFPRVSYPKDKEIFLQLAKLGSELRQIHLLESPIIDKFITTYPITGSNEVSKIKYTAEKAWINAEQYFDKVPTIAWEFYIGGYQPAQKWLKDRKGRTLLFEDIQ